MSTSKQIGIRLTPAEHDNLEEAAHRHGETLASFIRSSALARIGLEPEQRGGPWTGDLQTCQTPGCGRKTVRLFSKGDLQVCWSCVHLVDLGPGHCQRARCRKKVDHLYRFGGYLICLECLRKKNSGRFKKFSDIDCGNTFEFRHRPGRPGIKVDKEHFRYPADATATPHPCSPNALVLLLFMEGNSDANTVRGAGHR